MLLGDIKARTDDETWGQKTLHKSEITSRERGSGPLPRSRQHKIKLMLFLVSLAFSTVALISFDYSYTAAIQRHSKSTLKLTFCGVRDPVRYYALRPRCTCIRPWGEDLFEFVTNNLGFRDESIRDVPLADSRPRILLLGDSFTEGQLPWRYSYVGRIAAHFPQYDFLNGGIGSYSPSNYLNVARMVLAARVEIDEVVVFLDTADAADEAATFRDVDASGAVAGPVRQHWKKSWYARCRFLITKHLLLANDIIGFFERQLVGHGYYHLTMTSLAANVFDAEQAAWTYRKVNETDPYPSGYAPLGLEAGIAKEKAKMTLLWQELERRNIPISVVVYPYPGQVVHDTVDSKQVQIWRHWCEGKCKRFISLFPAFLGVKDQCPRMRPGCWYLSHFVFGDFHYNPTGNALVADAVIKSLDEDPPDKLQQHVSSTARQAEIQPCHPSSRRAPQHGDSSQNSPVIKRNCSAAKMIALRCYICSIFYKTSIPFY